MHAVSTMFLTRERPETYVDQCYMKSTQLKIYSNFISPIRGAKQWTNKETLDPIPPLVLRKPPERPHKKKKKKQMKPMDINLKSVRDKAN